MENVPTRVSTKKAVNDRRTDCKNFHYSTGVRIRAARDQKIRRRRDSSHNQTVGP